MFTPSKTNPRQNLRLFVGFFLFLITILSASAQYDNVGVNDSYQGNTKFTSTISETGTTVTQSSLEGVPLTADLDGDGESEIIVYSESTLYVYQATPPVLLASFNVESARGADFAQQQPFIMDVDNDGYKEVLQLALDIVHPSANSAFLYMHRWNGSSLNSTTLHQFTSLAQTLDQSVIRCEFDPTLKCLAVMADGLYFNSYVYLIAFDLTSKSANNVWFTDTANHDMACLPFVNSIAYSDWDNDGLQEFIFSWVEVGPAGRNEIVHVDAVSINSSLAILTDDTITEDTGSHISDAQPNCRTDGYGNLVTAPVVFNIDDVESNGDEAIVGMVESATGFKMRSFTSVGSGSQYDDYPEASSADGNQLGNVVRTDYYASTGRNDFCVNARKADGNITILCASEFVSMTPDNNELLMTAPYIMSFGGGRMDHVMSGATRPDGTDVLLTAYGTHVLSTSTHALDYQIPENDVSPVFTRLDGSLQNDIVGITSTNIWLWDDGFLSGCSSNGCIDEVFSNPCIEQTIKLNSTMEFRAQLTDADSGLVSARFTVYDGDSNEQSSGWSANVSSGSTISSSFTANKTITNGVLTVEARSTSNIVSVESKQFTFSVGVSGNVHGDVSCTDDFTAENISSVITIDETQAGNAIDSGMQTLASETSLGSNILWLFFMAMVAVGVWLGGREGGMDGSTTLGAMILFEVIMIAVGVKFGYIGFGMVVFFVMAGLVVAGVTVRRMFTGSGS